LILASAFLVASCVDSGRTVDLRGSTFADAGDGETQTMNHFAQDETRHPSPAEPLPSTGGSNAPDSAAAEAALSGSAAERVSARSTSPGGRRVSLRPRNNVEADDLLDHWGHRRSGLVSARLSQAPGPDGDVAGFRRLLEAARRPGAETPAPGLQNGDAIAVLGGRRGVTYGRWSGGPADTLSIDFDYQNAPWKMRSDRSFRAALERAGKAWSQRIDDTWKAWEREAGESKGRLIGNDGTDGREIHVGPRGETSTGIVIYVTGADLPGDVAGRGGPRSVRPGGGWEPHTGAVAFDNDYREEAGDASRFHTMVHEIGHVLGAWKGTEYMERYASFADRESGTWAGPNVVALHGGPAPFQDEDDEYGWHDGERSLGAVNFDFAHSGVCVSVMAYCAKSAAIPILQPAEIDFAFLRDLGLTTRRKTDRPETYGLAGWMDHSAFTLSVSRELDVSLADPQPRYSTHGAKWQGVDTIDLLWAEADAFGNRSTADLAASFPLVGTVRYSGGLIGTAVNHAGLPPVYGDANLSVGLESLTGEASFTSLEMAYNGGRYIFGDGNLHYPISVADNGIRDDAAGVSLIADFYGPRHEEVAGTLDDSRAGLLASFGARHDKRPAYLDVIAEADHVRGMMYQNDFGEEAWDGWYRYRCGAGPDCEGRFNWWEPGSAWYDLSATENRSPRERVLGWTAGWGDWLSEDMFADHGGIRIARRHASRTDGGTGRYQEDGYFGTMEHAAFGTGFYDYDDWERQDGERWDFYIRGTGFQGDLSGTRPAGSATWEGRMLGYQSGTATGEDPFVQSHARVSLSLWRNRVDIDFTGVKSMDRKRSLASFGFDDIPLGHDGTFDGFDQGPVEGAFFGPAHQEVAGMFYKNDNNVIGSFGAVERD
jgi:hypothetical protein